MRRRAATAKQGNDLKLIKNYYHNAQNSTIETLQLTNLQEACHQTSPSRKSRLWRS